MLGAVQALLPQQVVFASEQREDSNLEVECFQPQFQDGDLNANSGFSNGSSNEMMQCQYPYYWK